MMGSRSYPYTQTHSTKSDPDFMNTIITGDESWVYGYDPKPVIFSCLSIASVDGKQNLSEVV